MNKIRTTRSRASSAPPPITDAKAQPPVAAKTAVEPAMAVQVVEPPASSKLQRLIDLLERPDGATLSEMTEALGWQAHSVRGAMAGTLKARGHTIVSTKTDDVRRYRIAAKIEAPAR